jgi:hypothetical protein
MALHMARARIHCITQTTEIEAAARHRTMRLLGMALLLLTACVHTREFQDDKGQAIPATMEMLPVGGINQSLWFRASDTRHPALVIVHGGPGASEGALFRNRPTTRRSRSRTNSTKS